jgi:hypothetical protein
MRLLGVRGLIVTCLDQQCGHQTIFSVDDYADDIEVPSFVEWSVLSAAANESMHGPTGKKCRLCRRN